MKSNKVIIGIVLWVIIGYALSINPVFAADAATATNSDNDFIATFITTFLKLTSTIWMAIAILAGKLMTNEFVYGSILWLDRYLFLMWNIMKNLANFVLGFIFLVVVLKSFFSGEPAAAVKEYLPKILIWWVLVQASWFLLAALIDISTILTVSVGSFPSTLLWSSLYQTSFAELKESLPKNSICLDTQSYKLAECADETQNDIQKANIQDSDINEIVQNVAEPSGPLLFLWLSVLRLNEFTYIPDSAKTWDTITFATFLQFILMLAFIIPMVILVVTNAMRVFWIWIWAVFSPFIVLDGLFGWKISWKVKQFKLSSVIGLIMQPVAVVACLWLSMILVMWMRTVFSNSNATPADSSQPKICEEWSLTGEKCTIKHGWNEMEFEGSILKDTGRALWSWLGYLIMAFFTIFLFWSLIKVWFKTSEITSGFADSTFKFTEGMLKQTPIVPIGWWKTVWLSAASRWASALSNTLSKWIKANDAARAQEVINKLTGLSNRDINSSEYNSLTNSIVWTNHFQLATLWGNTKDYFTKLQAFAGKNDLRMNWSPTFKKAISTWLEKGWAQLLEDAWLRDPSLKDSSGKFIIDKFFSNAAAMTVIHNLMKEDLSTVNEAAIRGWVMAPNKAPSDVQNTAY